MQCDVMFYIGFIILLLGASHSLQIPNHHLPYIFHHHPELCSNGESCNVKNENCWGYEVGCVEKFKYGKFPLNCASKKWKDDFWRRVDFGYVGERQSELMTICAATNRSDSDLRCSRYTRYCVGRNVYFNFNALVNSDGRKKYREDLFRSGDVGGFCNLNQSLLNEQHLHKSPLQSWYGELQNFTSLSFDPSRDTQHCDVTLNHTVVFMKLDYGGNMFHHFCDFFNLYVSQHVNNSWFDKDIQIVMWDTATSHYFDPFSSSWKVFSNRAVTNLMDFKGKRVCARNVMFPLLARMQNGLYYNTYVPNTCVGSNMFRAFSEHFLHRMNITQRGPLVEGKAPKLRLTLLQRGNPTNDRVFRQIKNQPELVKSLEHFSDLKVQVVEYNWKDVKFEDQLQITHNSDIFIGMHGAGLTHFMFLPDWAVAFELYNCGDKRCYSDLARLRGLRYMTWPEKGVPPQAYDQGKHYRYGDNPKFWNWSFDRDTFQRLVGEARKAVLENPAFQQAVKEKNDHSFKTEL